MANPVQTGTFQAVREAIAPTCGRLSEAESAEGLRIAAGLLGGMSRSVRFQFRVFLALLELICVFHTGRRLASLPTRRRREVLETVRDSRIRPLRQGMWGLSTLTKASVYSLPSVQRRIGVRTRVPKSSEGDARDVPA
jgi:hypothetical protein